MKNILIPIDFSDVSKTAAEYGLHLATKFKSEVTFIHAYHIPSAGASSVVWTIEEDIKKDRLNELKEWKTQFKKAFPEVHISTKVSLGFAVNEIVQETELNHYDLIVMGTKGASGIKEALLGSITSTLIGKVSTPILAIPENVTYVSPKEFVLASDLKKINNPQLLNNFISLASQYEATVTVLNIENEHSESIEELFESIQEAIKIDEATENMPHRIVNLKQDEIEKAILNYANNKEANILAIIHRNRNFFQRLFHESLAKKLANHGHTPILVFTDN